MITTKGQKEHRQVYLDLGMDYVVLYLDESTDEYVTRHFTTRAKAESYNKHYLDGYGRVLTTRQLIKEFDCFPL